MKRILILIFSVSIIFSCTDDENTIDFDLLGRWKLSEILSDPGDGSGTFQSVISEKFIEFHLDGTVTSNGLICDLSIDSSAPSIGTYSVSYHTITSSDCPNSPRKINFKRTGPTLFISYPCFEACSSKYIKQTNLNARNSK